MRPHPPPQPADPSVPIAASALPEGLFALHAAAALFGLAGLFGKWLALPPATIVFGRALFAAATLALCARLFRLARSPLDARLAATGPLLALHWCSFFEAIRVSTVAVGLLGYASFPLFVLVFERVALRKPLRALEIATALLVTAGLVVVVPDLSLASATMRGLCWGVLSGASFAALTIINRSLARRRHPVDIAYWQNALAALTLLPTLPWLGAWPSAADVAGLALLGTVCTALAHTVFIVGMRTRSAHSASVVAALEPVYGAGLALILLGEVPSLRTLAGGTLIVTACVLQGRRAMPP